MQTLSPSNFQTLSGPIYFELREQLITGVFEPGQRLKLNELADYDGALSMTFDRTTFPCLWYLINNGASRGDTHLAIEPWTSAPSGLSNEPVLGEIAQIEASGVKSATVKLKSSNDQKTVIAAANLDQE